MGAIKKDSKPRVHRRAGNKEKLRVALHEMAAIMSHKD